MNERYADALKHAFGTIQRTIPKLGAERPAIGRADLTYQRCSADSWVDSFWSGQLWLAYAATKDSVFMNAAREQRPYFVERLDRPESHDHDLGFLYSLSLVAEHKLTGDADALRNAVRAADALVERYNAHGGFIRAWNEWSEDHDNRGRIIIDSMENLALLFWATEQTGEPKYKNIATAHAHTTADHIVRADGSTYHSFLFDPDTGQPLRGESVQGYADESCWSRGQSWAIHGFAVAFSYTGDVRFRDTSAQLADYALARLPEDKIPYWDYLLPEDEKPYRDTSAAAIMASGLFLLADQVENTAHAVNYRAAGCAILNSLLDGYTTFNYPDAEGLLTQGANYVKEGYADNMLPYGDYFFVEALLRAQERTAFFW